jgi:imidazolonepropionase-like amidohydrolase
MTDQHFRFSLHGVTMKRTRIMFAAVATLCGYFGLHCASVPTASTPPTRAAAIPGSFAIQDVRVLDGAKMSSPVTVVVAQGRIWGVGSNLSLPEGAPIIDGTGKTLLPGFIDGHAHVWSADQLEQSAQFGATTVLDMGCGDPEIGSKLRKLVSEPGSTLADLRFAGYAVTAPGAHCTEYGFPVPTITKPEDAQAFVDARLSEGSDYIKLVYDDAGALGFKNPTITKQLLKAAIEATHRRGKLALVHIGSMQGARDAIEVGADGLAHTFIDRTAEKDFGDFVAAHHAFVVPTLSVNRSLIFKSSGAGLVADADLGPYLPLQSAENLKKSLPTFPDAHVDYSVAEATIRLLHQAKVPILAGTDAPNTGTTHGATVHGELELLVGAGLTAEEALASATSQPATQFRLDDRGRIGKGLRADLVLVDGDPTVDIKATRHIVSVWRAGMQLDRKGYLAKIESEKSAAQAQAASPAPTGSEAGLISDFDDLTTSTMFGGGWATSTDELRGGKSTAAFKVVNGGASGSKGSMAVTGELVSGFQFPWAGVMFTPGERKMAPANLSAKREIVFSAKGDGATYQILLFSAGHGYAPARQVFVAGPEWKEYHFAFADFDGMDGRDLMGIAFVQGARLGRFRFQLDSFRLK